MSLSCAGLDLSYVYGFTCKDIISLKTWLAAVPYFPNTIIFFNPNKLEINFCFFCFPEDHHFSTAKKKKKATTRAAYIFLFFVPLDKWGLHISISTSSSSNILPDVMEEAWRGGLLQLGMLASGGFAFSLLYEPPSESEALFRKKYCLIQILGEKYLN